MYVTRHLRCTTFDTQRRYLSSHWIILYFTHLGIVPALLLVLSLLLCITPGSSHFVNPEDGKVLVLGSGGLIGSHVVKWLKTNDYEVAEVRNRAHVDLRQEDALDAFQAETISFVFFLACEVGGSKYIDNDISSVQLAIVESNVQMYQVVFGWLKKHQIPFAFSSSYMHFAPTSYGAIKRLGEAWIRSE